MLRRIGWEVETFLLFMFGKHYVQRERRVLV